MGAAMNDDPEDRQRRDDIARFVDQLQAFREGRSLCGTDPLTASRLAILDDATPPAAPRLRVIQGGKA